MSDGAQAVIDSIEQAKAGEIVVLPSGITVITKSIRVPDGVQIVGQVDTVLVADFSQSYSGALHPLFELEGTVGASFTNFRIELGPQATGFRGLSGTADLLIENVEIQGDLFGGQASGFAIYLKGALNVVVRGVHVEEAMRGFYFYDSSYVTIENSSLTKVALGNIVINGSNYHVNNNLIVEPGHPQQIFGYLNAGGDGITVGQGSTDIEITGNTILGGYCYGIWVPHGGARISISDNRIENGITSGIELRDVVDATVTNNYLSNNGGAGVGIVGAVNQVVTGNEFVNNTLFVRGSTDGTYTWNTFSLSGRDEFHGSIFSDTDTVSDNSVTQVGSTDTNQPPVLTHPVNTIAIGEQELFNVQLDLSAFSDPDGHYLVYHAEVADGSPSSPSWSSMLPDWIKFQHMSGILVGSAPAGTDDLRLRLVAKDHFGGESSIEFTIVVTAPGDVIGTASGDTLVGTEDGDRIHGLSGDDVIYGSAGGDILSGNDGNDQLHGNGGNDRLQGGDGDDLLDGGDGSDTASYAGSGAAVTLNLSVSEVQITGGSGADRLISIENLIGSAFDDTLTGNLGANTIEGGDGNDTLDGAAGIDTVSYAGATAGVTVDLSNSAPQNTGGAGTDTLTAFENVIGSGFADTLRGTAGDNVLDGGAGADRMHGGAGNDTYHVDSGAGPAPDVVSENASEGTDTVNASVSYTLAANVENLVLTGAAAIDGYGNALNNTITGNAATNVLRGHDGNDHLYGGDGNDYLGGGAGIDYMYGGLGNDIYAVEDSTDYTIENAGEGTDSVYASLTHTLRANIENMVLSGTAAINGYGNGLDNLIQGNAAANVLRGHEGNDRLYGYGGDDILNGGTGIDAMYGGAGNDTYVIMDPGDYAYEYAGEGTDTVYTSMTYTILPNIENLVLYAGYAINGYGNELDNLIQGNELDNVLRGDAGNDRLYGYGGNDVLSGGAGIDAMRGGTGDDTYVITEVGDYAYEYAGEGTDTVYSSMTYTLLGNVENLILYAGYAINGYGNELDNLIQGNELDNVLRGDAGNDRLYGYGGNDVLSGGAGIDAMRGGAGDDTYVITEVGDYAYEYAGEGTDTVYSSMTYTLLGNVENLILYAGYAINGYGNELNNLVQGNELANVLRGHGGNDRLNGRDGNDVLTGGAGIDLLTGGSGADLFVFADGDFGGLTPFSSDRIVDFSHAEGDRIHLSTVDANSAAVDDQAFTFIGSGAFTNTAGELRYEQVNGHTYVYGDTNGNGVADFMLQVEGLHTLNTGDFIL